MFTTLRSKILAGFAALIAINTAFGLWAIFQFSSVGESATDQIASSYDLVTNSVQLGSILDRQVDQLQSMAVTPTPDPYIVQFEQGTTDFRFMLAKLVANRLTAGQRGVIDSISVDYERFLRGAAQYRNVLTGRERGDPRDILYRTILPVANQLKQRSLTSLFRNQEEISDVRTNLRGELAQALYFVGIATAIGTLVSILGAGFYARWALRPIARLTQAVQNLRGGRLGERIHITTADELGDLSFEFNRMLERLHHYDAMNIEQLLLEKRKVETIVQSIATPIVVVDAQMRLVLINNAAITMFRLSASDSLEGKPLAEFINDEAVLASLKRALARRDEPGGGSPDIYMLHEEGAERFYAIDTHSLATTSAVSGVVAVFSDITHFKELDRLKSEFLAKVSHEFRTPLSSIIMSLDILREGIMGPINAEQLDLLNASKDDCRRLSKLITDLLELSRMEAKMRHRSSVLIDFPALIDAVLKPHRLPAREKGVEIVEDLAGAVPLLWAEPEEMRWLINNLVSNALRHTDAGGRITVGGRVDAGHLVVTVEDTGHGIPLDSLHMIFEKFHQVGSPSVATPGSVGLGLAIAKDVVESYGGRISVTSELHKGSCFTVRIPLDRLAPPSIAGDGADHDEIAGGESIEVTP